jgi:hypothetical protein
MAKDDDEELLKVLAESMEFAAAPTLGDTEEPGERVQLA